MKVCVFIILTFRLGCQLLDGLEGRREGRRVGIQSLNVLYSANFECCCDYIEEIPFKRVRMKLRDNEADESKRDGCIQGRRKREICLYPQLLLYLTHTKMWRYNPLLRQKEVLYSSFLYSRAALGVWASVGLGTCSVEHKSEADGYVRLLLMSGKPRNCQVARINFLNVDVEHAIATATTSRWLNEGFWIVAM